MIDHAETRIDLEKSIAQLPDKTGRVMTAIGLEGKSIKETSDSIGISENAVRLQFHRGVRKLRDLFNPGKKGKTEKKGKNDVPAR